MSLSDQTTGAPNKIEPVVIVGDTFAALAKLPKVQTVSQFVESLRKGETLPSKLIAGQGVSDYEMEHLRDALNTYHESGESVPIDAAANERVSRAVAHKHRENNVLLADLTPEGDGVYRANLRLHSDNELLQDHHTGQHVQGIVIIEAFRQMFIAVFEASHGVRMAQQKLFVVWDAMDVTFTSFLFPLAAQIVCQVVEEDVSDPSRMSFRVRMEVHQSGQEAAHADIRFGVHDNDKITSVERKRADRAVTSQLESGASR
jgi:hypothetical protein